MSHFLRSNKKIVLVLFLITLLPFIARIGKPYPEINTLNEKYNEKLRSLNTLDKLVSYSEQTYKTTNPNSAFDTSKYVAHLSDLMKERFYHGDLKYTFSENWIAWAFGKSLWSHMSFIVITDDVLKHGIAICSQQTMVFMEALREKNISVRSVGLGFDQGPGHFLCEVWYGGAWHLHDVNTEPSWKKVADDHKSLDYYLTNKESLYKVYEGRLPKALLDKILERHIYGKVNMIPAKNMKLFQWIAKILTYLFPVFFGSLFIFTLFQGRSSNLKEDSPVYPASNDKFVIEKINS